MRHFMQARPWAVLGAAALILACRPVGAAEGGVSACGLQASGQASAATTAAPAVPTRKGFLVVAEGKATPLPHQDAARQLGASAVLVLDGQDAAAARRASSDATVELLRPQRLDEPRSALFTGAAPAVSMFTASWGAERLAGLMREDPQRGPVLLALLVPGTARAGGPALDAYWYEQDRDGSTDSRLLDLAALEHLYAYILRQPVEQAFAFRRPRSGGQTTAAPDGPSSSQKDVLATVAALRECTVEALSAAWRDGLSPRRWRTVSIEAADPGAAEDDKAVAVKVGNALGPVVGATVAFARDPHWVCSGTVDAAGLARCRLWDAHGHAGHDDDDGKERQVTIATFGGAVHHDSINLPTTLVLDAAAPTEARRKK